MNSKRRAKTLKELREHLEKEGQEEACKKLKLANSQNFLASLSFLFEVH